MNVLVDSSLFPNQLLPLTGHGRIWNNIFRRLPPDADVFCNTHIRNLPTPQIKPLREPPFSLRRPYRLGGLLSDCTSYAIDRYASLDLLAPSLYTPQKMTLRLARRIPLVTILDDLTPELVPGTMPQWIEPKKRLLNIATLIISISESTKKLAMAHYNLPEEKFRVVHLASDLTRPNIESTESPHKRPFFLVVGKRQGYKNFDLTLRSFAAISSKVVDVDLLLAGPSIADFEKARIAELRITDRVYYAGKPDDLKLSILYAYAEGLIYPSLSEGFGIPPLEAMICGSVPIVSNRTSMPEVVGEAGIKIDPNNVDDLVDAMLSLITDSIFRSQLLDKGFIRAGAFSWIRTTDLIFDAWREAGGFR